MNWVKDLANYISNLLKWWVVVLPWQEGIRIRLGKNETHLTKGIYLKLPIIDSVFIQNVRFRYTQLPIQTVTTKDGITVTLTGSIGYEVVNVRELYNKISNPEATIAGAAMTEISQYFASHCIADCTPLDINNNIKIDVQRYGLRAELKLSSFAAVRTYRLIQDNSWMPTDKDFEI